MKNQKEQNSNFWEIFGKIKMKMKTKILIVLIAVVLVAAGGMGYYFRWVKENNINSIIGEISKM